MRDQYAGDVSDYLKFAFLRQVAGGSGTLGVAWYFLDGHDGRADGRHDEYLDDPSWAALDPDLFAALKDRPARSVEALERLAIWPGDVRFHRTPVTGSRGREGWAADLVKSLDGVQAVFADPDNGVSRPGVLSPKSATIPEVEALARDGRTVFLIRFPHRVTSHDNQLVDYHGWLRAFAPVTVRTCVRVPNRNGSTSPRIRWFTALNAGADTRARVDAFAARLNGLPMGSATVV